MGPEEHEIRTSQSCTLPTHTFSVRSCSLYYMNGRLPDSRACHDRVKYVPGSSKVSSNATPRRVHTDQRKCIGGCRAWARVVEVDRTDCRRHSTGSEHPCAAILMMHTHHRLIDELNPTNTSSQPTTSAEATQQAVRIDCDRLKTRGFQLGLRNRAHFNRLLIRQQ